MIVFRNPGLVDMTAVTVLGINAKENESPIGYFGTGLKYAIAVLLRNGQDITVYRGLEPYRFSSKEEIVRGKVFHVVYMNDERLGFTTDMGRNWTLFEAFRELYSNMHDEGGEMYSLPSGDPREYLRDWLTTVVVSGRQFDQVYEERHQVVLDPKLPLIAHGIGVEVYGGTSQSIFHQGIAALKYRSLYTYNITDKQTLTEDRTLSNTWTLTQRVAELVQRSTNKDFIRVMLQASRGYFENEVSYPSWSYQKASDEFWEVLTNLAENEELGNDSALVFYKNNRKQKETFTPLELTPEQQTMYARAVAVNKAAGHQVDSHPVNFVQSINAGVLGCVKEGKIYISATAFHEGEDRLAGTLLEEWLHREHGYSDMSRGLQNWLVDRVITLSKELKEARQR